jgi:alpha-ketoglutarate-dependent taurine dioxygenase
VATTGDTEVRKLTETVGAEMLGVDLERFRTDETFPATVMAALEEHGVLVFRGLHMDDETQTEFCGRLGDVVLFPGQENPAIFVVSLDPEKNPMASYLRATVGWHIDGTVDPIPAKATMLSAKVLSATGGETEFASTYAAYDDLDDDEKERCAGLRVWHSQEASQRDGGHEDPSPEQLEEWRRRSREHPLVWTHQTGRLSLVIGHSADRVIGMELEEGRALLRDLDARATRPERVYRHTWSEGDTVLWDNRGVVHRVTPYDAGSRREMHRTTLHGEEPIR